MTIDYDNVPEREDEIVDGPGTNRITPAGRGDRTYGDTALADETWPATDARFTSATSVLGRGVPTDWTGPAKWNVARISCENWEYLTSLELDARVKEMVSYADASLNAAADRGSAIHRAAESILAGIPVDRDDLARCEAMPWLLALERAITELDVRPVVVEAVCFDRDTLTAGTVDLVATVNCVEGVQVIDFKTRKEEHDRRPKEAAQGGGYAAMLSDGYYMSDRGVRTSIADIAGIAIVTLAPDGTWAWHQVDVIEARAHFLRAVDMANHNKVSTLFDGKAIKSTEPDFNALALERIGRIPEGSVWLKEVKKAWKRAGLGRPTQGELTAEDWPTVDEILWRRQPFPEPRIVVDRVAADPEAVDSVHAELGQIPKDILTRLRGAHAPAFRRFESGLATVEDVEDIDRLIGSVTDEIAGRKAEVENLLLLAMSTDIAPAILAGTPANPALWLETDLERVSHLWVGVDTGKLRLDGDQLTPTVPAIEELAASGKADARRRARPVAEQLGRHVPKNWAELCADPVLFMAAQP